MKNIWYIIIIIIIIALVWVLYTNKFIFNQTTTMPTNENVSYDWSGLYTYRHDAEATNDGTSAYDITVVKNGNVYDVTYDFTGNLQIAYKGIGTVNSDGNLDVVFDSPITNNVTQKKGTPVFVLQRSTDNGQISMMQVMANNPIIMQKK